MTLPMNAKAHFAARTLDCMRLWCLACLFAAGAALAQPPDFVHLVEQVSPAVVNIEATRTSESQLRSAQPGDAEMEEFLRRFFGQPGPGPGPQLIPPPDRTSMGSGFIISADGYVLTNHHVVDGADEIVVRLPDRREYDAELVGGDPQSDVALLKIEASGLPTVRIGDSDALRPGQWVLAIGSPFGFDHSVTSGIVSAVGRASFDPSQQYVPFIQTDVAINRGNSGGPLFNTDGEVVGINSQIFSNTGGFLGISFAIPIEVAMNAVQQLKTKGRVTRGLLGVNIQDVTRDLARALGLPRPMGAIVQSTTEGGAAAKAGIQQGDVIVAFNGEEVNRSAELPPMVGITPPGTRATVTVFRNGRNLDIPVVIGALDPEEDVGPGAEEAAADDSNRLGLVIEELDAEQREALDLAADEGVLVTAVSPGARRGNVQPGDVVLMVGRQRIGSAAAFEAAIARFQPGEAVMLLVRRGQASFFTALTVPAEADEETVD